MARGQDLLFAHHGNSDENNATKNLCWLLNVLPKDVSTDLIRPFVEPFSEASLLEAIDAEDVDVVAQENTAQAGERAETAVLLGLAANGHSYADTGIAQFDPEDNQIKNSRRLDLTFQLGDELVIGIEAKDGGFSHTQLRDHARELGASQFETITWGTVADTFESVHESQPDTDANSSGISGISLPSGSTELLLDEYAKLLRDQLISRTSVIATSQYTKGTNFVKVKKEIAENTVKGHVSDDSNQSFPLPAAIYFRASGQNTDGHRLYFGRNEWVSLLKSIRNSNYHRDLANGDITGVKADWTPGDGDMVIAHIEDSDGNEKAMFYGTGKGDRDNDLLYLN